MALTKEQWIDGNDADFKALFSGSRDEDCSVFSDAYEDKGGVVIHEYYLNIDLSNKERCLNYFSNDYCSSYSKQDKATLDDEIIKRDGVLYEHLFVKVDDNYYLKRSFVVSE
ncbi:MAG: hypothetical protein II625_10205 [Bacilli bacterium]|nr:hypothetical protein [Bacilli bacterium]